MKTCPKCNITKDLNEFYVKKNGKVLCYCKKCYGIIAKDRYHKMLKGMTPEEKIQFSKLNREASKRWRDKDDGEKNRESQRNWVAKNRDKHNADRVLTIEERIKKELASQENIQIRKKSLNLIETDLKKTERFLKVILKHIEKKKYSDKILKNNS